MTSFCPRCGTPRVGSFRYCRSCGLDIDNEATDAVDIPAPVSPAPRAATPDDRAARVLLWVVVIFSAIGFAWLWWATGPEVTIERVIIVFLLGLTWSVGVTAVVGFVAMILGLGWFLIGPRK